MCALAVRALAVRVDVCMGECVHEGVREREKERGREGERGENGEQTRIQAC